MFFDEKYGILGIAGNIIRPRISAITRSFHQESSLIAPAQDIVISDQSKFTRSF